MKKKGDINGYVSNFKFKSLLINLWKLIINY
jgi:hypothetical protein